MATNVNILTTGLTPTDDLIMGWDKVPHHPHIATSAHHLHVAGATVTVSAHGDSVVVETAEDGSGAAAYFMAGLSSEPLEVEPGDEVSITASFEGQSKTLTFIAQPGSQQVDVVLPQNGAATRWQRVDLSKRLDHAMAYDGEHMLLFGGLDSVERLNDTEAMAKCLMGLYCAAPPIAKKQTLTRLSPNLGPSAKSTYCKASHSNGNIPIQRSR
jgi:hypothetical protein